MTVTIPLTAPRAGSTDKREHLREDRRQPFAYLWVAPAVALFAVFVVLPAVVALGLSFTQWDGITAARFAGLANFRAAFTDGAYWTALVHNLIYAIGTVAGKLVLSLGLALILNASVPARAFFRTALFMPVVLSFVAVGMLWSFIYSYNIGLLNNLLGLVGLDGLERDWLGDQHTALAAVIVVDIWKWFGFHMIIFLAGLQAIPNEVYEASRIDGAGWWRQLTSITLPLIVPVATINLILSLAGAFNVFDVVYIMTTGGPNNATDVAMLEIYTQAFQFNKYGYSAALSVVQLLVVSLVSLGTILAVGRRTAMVGHHG